MYAQGYSLGRQLAEFIPPLAALVAAHPGRVWFLGRDMDAFYVALKEAGYEVRYLSGLNRKTTPRLRKTGRLERWLRTAGVREGNILVDTGFFGSLFATIEWGVPQLRLQYFLLGADNPHFEAAQELVPWLNTQENRNLILRLEHGPKRDRVLWDDQTGLPRIVRVGGKAGQEATAFLRGCVTAFREVCPSPPAASRFRHR